MLWKQHHPYANCNFCVRCISFLLLYTSCLKRAASLFSDEENAFDPPHSLCFFFCKQHHAFHLDLDRPLFLWIIRFPWYSSLKIEIVRLERGFLGWEVRVLWTLIRKVSLTYGKAKKGKYVCMSKNNVKNTKYRRWIEKISLEEII